MLRMVPLPFQGRICGCGDVVDDGFYVAKHFGGGDAEDSKTPVFEPAIPQLISLWPVASLVRLPIDFYDQARRVTEEIC